MRSCCTCHYLIEYGWFRYLSPDPPALDLVEVVVDVIKKVILYCCHRDERHVHDVAIVQNLSEVIIFRFPVPPSPSASMTPNSIINVTFANIT